MLCSRCPSAIYFTRGNGSASIRLSWFVPSPFLPSRHVCSLSLRLFFCPANGSNGTTFLDSTFMHSYRILVCLCLTYFTPYDRLGDIRISTNDLGLFLFILGTVWKVRKTSGCSCCLPLCNSFPLQSSNGKRCLPEPRRHREKCSFCGKICIHDS